MEGARGDQRHRRLVRILLQEPPQLRHVHAVAVVIDALRKRHQLVPERIAEVEPIDEQPLVPDARLLERVDVVRRHHAAVGVVRPLRAHPRRPARAAQVAHGDQVAREIGQAPPRVVAGVVVDQQLIDAPAGGRITRPPDVLAVDGERLAGCAELLGREGEVGVALVRRLARGLAGHRHRLQPGIARGQRVAGGHDVAGDDGLDPAHAVVVVVLDAVGEARGVGRLDETPEAVVGVVPEHRAGRLLLDLCEQVADGVVGVEGMVEGFRSTAARVSVTGDSSEAIE